MKKTFIAALLLTLAQTGLAMPHPCTPTVEARPTVIHCEANNIIYTIQINTLMSRNIPMCQGSNRYETHTAHIELSDEQGLNFAEINISDDSAFEYRLRAPGRSTFKSEKLGLDLNNCSTPLHGGISIGN